MLRTSQIVYHRDQIVALIHADLAMRGQRVDDDYEDEWSDKLPATIVMDVATVEAKMFKRGKKGSKD
jgi:hypothetical protein